MNHVSGKRMAELHLRFKKCKTPYLNDDEVVELRDWIREIYDYHFMMSNNIEALYFGMEYESLVKICVARGFK